MNLTLRLANQRSRVPGIYGILNIVTGRIYVGSAVDLLARLKDHLKLLNSQSHYNAYLQNAWNLYGKECFQIVVLSIVEQESELTPTEQHYLDTLPLLYNLDKTARRPTDSVVYSPAYRQTLTEANVRSWKDPVIRERRLAGMRGSIKHTPEGLKRISETSKARRFSSESRKKMSDSHKARVWTQEHRDNLAKANKARSKK